MSRPRTAPMRDALAPVFARRGDRGEINRLARVLLGPPPESAEARLRRYLAEHPDVSANEALGELKLRLRRSDALRLVRAVRKGEAPAGPFEAAGTSGYHRNGESGEAS